MFVYVLNVLLLGLYSFIYNLKFKGSKKAKIFFITLAILQLILLLTLKNVWVGSDMPNYWGYFQDQLAWDLGSLSDIRFEIGFKILTKIITTFTDNQQVYLGVIALLSTLPVGYLAYKYSRMPFLTLSLYVLLGFFAFTFSGLRQAIAMGFVLLSFVFLRESKLLKYLLCIGLAVSFHFSAIIFLPVYLIRKITLSYSALVLFGILALGIFLFKAQLLMMFASVFYPSYSIVTSDSYAWMLMCIAIVMFCIAFYNNVIKADKENNVLYLIVIIGSLMMLFAPVADNVMRIANYFFIFVILLIPEVIQTIKGAKMRALVSGIFIIGSVSVYGYLLQVDGYRTVPYHFYWEHNGANLESNLERS